MLGNSPDHSGYVLIGTSSFETTTRKTFSVFNSSPLPIPKLALTLIS